MTWTATGPQGFESRKIRYDIVPYTRGQGLDLGCGQEKAFPHFIGVDNMHHAHMFGMQMKPDVFLPTCEDLSMFASGSMDFVFSSHLLEHIHDYKKALREWWRVVKVGGYLVLYLPHKDLYPRVGQPGANPDHKHDFDEQDIINAMHEVAPPCFDLVENQIRGDGHEYSFFQVYRKTSKAKNGQIDSRPPPGTKTAGVVRYGAIGDMMMMTSVVAGLKKQGFHVTVHAAAPGHTVVEHDPNIDRLVVQDKDQVPNAELGAYWSHLRGKYDRFVNLSESCEGTLLAVPARIERYWPVEVRRNRLNSNYLEFQHALAGVAHVPRVKFYPTIQESVWAKKQRSRASGKVVLWALSGSSVHKVWPHLDAVMARILLEMPETTIVLTGDSLTAMLEAGWENEPRVWKRCGKWSIRETLAFAQQCDLIIGPETGVLNAMCCEPMAKVVFLSHSSNDNLTRDWVNTFALTPDQMKVPCYPCHLLHYGWGDCHKHEESGTAECAWNIGPNEAWGPISHALRELEFA